MQKQNHQLNVDVDFLDYMMKQPFLSHEEELELFTDWQKNQNQASFNQLVSAHMRLVFSIAVKFRYYGLPLSDLVQEGSVGLLEAVRRFDLDHNVRFSSYAKWWVKASIQDHILRNRSIVRMGATTAHKILFFHLNRLRTELGYLAYEPLNLGDIAGIAKQLNVQMKEVEFMEKRLSFSDFSLSANINDDTENMWIDLLEDIRPTPEESSIQNAVHKNQKCWVEVALSHLPPREQYIITHRRLTDPHLTLEEIGHELALTKERVRQLEIKGLRRMRFILKKHFGAIRSFLSV